VIGMVFSAATGALVVEGAGVTHLRYRVRSR
jgi:hypothetical protein